MEESKTTTATKRKRLTLACNVCRRKKIRCDGIKPTCGKCVRFHQECSYTSTMKKRGPRQGHIELLEQRLKKMEELMIANKNTIDTNSIDNINSGNSSGVLPPILSHINLQSNTPQLGYSIIPQTSIPTSFTPTQSPTVSMAAESVAPVIQDDLPSDDIIEHLLDLFFLKCATVSPIIDITGFRKTVRDKTCNRFLLYSLMAVGARFSTRPDIIETPGWASGEKYAIKARGMIGKVLEGGSLEYIQGTLMLTLHEFGCGRGNRCWTYTGISVRMTFEVGLHKELIFEEAPGTILTLDRWYWYETRRRTFWDAFIQDKFASASTGRPFIIDAKDCEIMLSIDHTVLELGSSDDFYQCNLSGSKLVHYRIIRDDHNIITGIQFNPLNVEIPEHKVYLKRVGWESRIIQLFVILGKVTQLVNRGYKIEDGIYGPYKDESEFEKLDKELDAWVEGLPLQIKNTPANLEQFRELNSEFRSAKFLLGHTLHNSLVVLLNRPSLVIADMPALGHVTQDVQDRVHKSMDKCLAAADNVTVMLKDLCCQIDVIPPFITYLIYTTATVMVNSSFSINPIESQKAKTALNEYFKFLENMKVYWVMAEKLGLMIHDLYAVHQKVVDMNSRNPSPEDNNSTTAAATRTWNHSSGSSEMTTNDQAFEADYPYPLSSAIPIRKLPMAEVSMSTSDYTIDQNWEYNGNTIDTGRNDSNSLNNNNVFLQNTRSRLLFNDSSLSSFDSWIQQQQQQVKKPS